MLTTGDVIAGRYVVEAVLGEGGTSTVYRVRHTTLDLPLALKVLHRPSSRQWLLREGQLLARLQHPNIVQVHDFLHIDGRPGLLMEYVPDSLAAVQAQQSLSTDQALILGEQILQGLAAAHLQGFIHRDLKPANILVRWRSGQPWALLCDFGLGEALRGPLEEPQRLSGMAGTPGYMAPEQYRRAGRIDERADVFSVAVVLYELLTRTGLAAHLRQTQASAAALRAVPLAHTVRAGIPPHLGILLAEALSAAPGHRPDVPAFLEQWTGVAAPPQQHRAPAPVGQYTQTITPDDSLPQVSGRFFGRSGILADMAEQLAAAGGVLTLQGIGGVGKTRLALQHARREATAYPGGRWFVDLAQITDAGAIRAQVARALHLMTHSPSAEQLGTSLAARGRCLLVLDNAEQVREPLAALLAVWVPTAPEARILVTSRIALGLPDERCLTLGPLSTADAVALFEDRAAQRASAEHLSADDHAVITEIVSTLDGLCLAIELAATWLDRLSLSRLQRRLHTLGRWGNRASPDHDARHQSMHRVLEDSWAMLTEVERIVLAGCAVFTGGFSLQDAEAVLSLDGVERWAIEGLVRKNLLRPLSEGRWAPFEVVRMYAERKLSEQGGGEGLRRRHATHFARLGSPEAIDALHTHDGTRQLQRLTDNLENLKSACRWAIANKEAGLAAHLSCALYQVFGRTGPISEAGSTVDRVLGLATLTGAERVMVLIDRARVYQRLGQFDQVATPLREAEALLEGLGAPRLRGMLMIQQALGRSGPEAAIARCREALAFCRAHRLRAHEGVVLAHMLVPLMWLGDYAACEATALEASVILEEVGDTDTLLTVRERLGRMLNFQGKSDAAEAVFLALLSALEGHTSAQLKANVCSSLGYLYLNRSYDEPGLLVKARQMMELALEHARLYGHRRHIGVELAQLGMVFFRQGEIEEAVLHLEETVELLQDDDPRLLAQYQLVLAEFLSWLGEAGRARELLETGRARLKAEPGSPNEGEVRCIEGHVAWGAGDDEAAAAMLTAADAIRAQNNLPEDGDLGRSIAALRGRIASGKRSGVV